MHTDTRPRLVVLGLDGLPFSLARHLCAQGRTPNLARIAASPHASALAAELPDLSPVNWTSFYTASGPETHGVYGFTRFNVTTRQLSLADFSQVTAPTLFDRLGERGLTSRVINLPNTYPARPIPGMLISGFVAHDLARAVHPPFLLGPLTGAGYRLEADTARGGSDPAHLLAELRVTLASRRAALRLLWPDLAWNLFVLVLTETDRLFHFLWDAVTDEGHPQHPACMEFLAEWDALVGEVLDLAKALSAREGRPVRLLALADHGFGPVRAEVDLNAWLRGQGLLRQVTPGGVEQCHELDATTLHPDSAAFALDPGRIYLRTRRRFPDGTLDDAAGWRLAERLRRELMALTFEGAPVFRAVLTADEAYGPEVPGQGALGQSGPCQPGFCQPNPGQTGFCQAGSRLAGSESGVAGATIAGAGNRLLPGTGQSGPASGPVAPSVPEGGPPLRWAAPDLVCVPAYGFDLKAKWNRSQVFGLPEQYGRTGTHTPDDAFWYDSQPDGVAPVSLRDVGALVLRHFGLDAPQRTVAYPAVLTGQADWRGAQASALGQDGNASGAAPGPSGESGPSGDSGESCPARTSQNEVSPAALSDSTAIRTR
ncbi:alkaline phosphatase family protein [Nitratidesulfovibrio liaohensis]|uniref:Alkaline phosphatase family protein n=1 Tax=Nitratidesulfovibrio liaohensis TaxID=2604158 RepID=A0ABY9QYT7_9BACT|nr:alkaline phosphatase family protein [Nitratidesulfovibrio liaohensis]WMW64216.1 alkaline phosphatase family protein [Nitratidesulfovibrio liaohensis]